jgi:pilus assembly protein CpaB
MKPKAYIFAGLAIVCGLGASYMTSRLLAERTQEEPERVDILVAKRTINVGERVVKPEDMFELKAVLKENEPPDAIKDFDAVKGKSMKSTRNKGDHITLANLHDKDNIDLPEGHRAVGVNVNLGTTAHGLASLPGSRVDLVLTARGNGNDLRTATARVLLHNVLVLAADARTNREGDQIAPASVVTFALTPKDSLKVTLAKQLGELSLVLRKLNDAGNEEGDVVDGNDVFGKKKKDDEKPAPTPAAPAIAQEVPTPTPVPVVEKKDVRELLINNGTSATRYRYEVGPDGEIRDAVDGDLPAPPPPPAPRVQPRPQQQPQPQRGGGQQDF